MSKKWKCPWSASKASKISFDEYERLREKFNNLHLDMKSNNPKLKKVNELGIPLKESGNEL
jgi:hypothetical protein